MEDGTLPPSDPVSFVISENQGYAMTPIATCEAAEFLMTKLEQVNIDDIDPNDRKCQICWEEFHVSEDVTLSHAPVKTVCGHMFGHKCITQYLDPLCFDRAEDHDESVPYIYGTVFDPEVSKSSCPICQRVFFRECYQEELMPLRLRLWFWDAAYAQVGVVRSEKEERSRKYLWEYVKFCELFEHKFTEEISTDQLNDMQWDAFHYFSHGFNFTNPNLTPAQEHRRKLLEHTADSMEWMMRIASEDTMTNDGTFQLGSSRRFSFAEDSEPEEEDWDEEEEDWDEEEDDWDEGEGDSDEGEEKNDWDEIKLTK